MELSYGYLRTKEVVNVVDGRKLGKVTDIVFCYPENRVIGLVVPGGKGVFSRRNEQFIEMKNIVKIGDDVVLVNIGALPKQSKGRGKCSSEEGVCLPKDGGRRSFEEYE